MILNIDDWVNKTVILGQYLPRITSPSLRLKSGSYDEKGLFSTEFFGQRNSDKWKQMYSVIELPVKILHPAYYYIIDRRISFLKKWIDLEIGAEYKNNNFVLTNDTNKYDLCGLSSLYDNAEFLSEQFEKTGKVETKAFKVILDLIVKKDPKVWTSYILIPPPLFRGDDADNDLYVRIIEELQILRSAISSNDKILKNKLLFTIQNIHNQIFEQMVNKIKGKTGLIRGSILGRNADFSGRAVIVGDPTIDANHLGIPKTMLVRLFYPWIIHYIMTNREVAMELSKYTPVNKPSLHNLINEKLLQEDISENVMNILYAVTAEVIKDKVILAKRDPSLHKFSIKAYYPIMVDDASIHISPSVCPGHNADFDGDQMAVFVPLSKESQAEAKNTMMSSENVWSVNSGLSLVLEKDFPADMYFISKNEGKGTPKRIADDVEIFEAMKQVNDFSELITYRGRTNTLGRRIIELIFDDHFVIDYPVNKGKLEKLFISCTHYGGDYLVQKILLVQKITGIVSSIMGGDIGVDSFQIPPDLRKRRDEVLAHPDKYDVSKELKDISEEFIKRADNSGQYAANAKNSGLKKIDFQQTSVAKGYISDVNGNTDPTPIGSNFADGFTSTDYFKSAAGNRKGVVDRVMNTAKSGYLSRQMVYLLASIKTGPSKFCGTKKLVELVLTDELAGTLEGRVLESGEVITPELIEKKKLLNTTIRYYSPMYCKSPELCEHCYPKFFRDKVNNVKNVGIISAQVIGERCTQLIMVRHVPDGKD